MPAMLATVVFMVTLLLFPPFTRPAPTLMPFPVRRSLDIDRARLHVNWRWLHIGRGRLHIHWGRDDARYADIDPHIHVRHRRAGAHEQYGASNQSRCNSQVFFQNNLSLDNVSIKNRILLRHYSVPVTNVTKYFIDQPRVIRAIPGRIRGQRGAQLRTHSESLRMDRPSPQASQRALQNMMRTCHTVPIRWPEPPSQAPAP